MFPGQRTSRRNQELESMAMDATDPGDYDDYGMPSRPASGASKSKSGKFMNRFRKQASSANVAGQMDGDSDEDDAYVPPGSAGTAFRQGQFQQYAPPSAEALHAPHAAAHDGAPSPTLPSDHGEISMEQISSLRDRHRYPGFEDDSKNGRAMSLNSMSTYDTTPIIPMLGPVTNFQSGSAHNRATPQEKYRQRMIESRRALLSSETAIPLSGTLQPGRPQGQSDTYLSNLAGVPHMSGTPRSMSLSSSPAGPVGPPGPGLPQAGSRSMTMMSGPPAPMRGPPHGPMSPHPGAPHPGHPGAAYPGAPHPGAPHPGAPHPGAPHPGTPMYYNGPYGPPHNPGSGAGPPPQGLPQRPPSNQGAWNARQPGSYPQQPMHHGSASHGSFQGPGYPGPGQAPPAGYSRGPEHALPPPQGYQRSRQGSQSQGSIAGPASQSQYDTSNEAFDFGPEYSNQQQHPDVNDPVAKSAATAQNESDRRVISELNAKLEEREEEIRMLSIELAESSRRELQLNPVHDKDGQDRAAALAKAHDELSLERSRRSAIEKAATNPDVAVHGKLADMDHRHSEAVHLLAIRTEQYEMLQKKHASLNADYEQRLRDYDDLATRFKESEIQQRAHQQDQLLGQQVRTLETENAKLRQQVDEASPQGQLGERVASLEEQRKVLQETLRTMRERKDSEINALRSRLEQLQLQVQQQKQNQRGRISSAGSSSGTAPNSAGSASDGSTHAFRPTPVRAMSRQASTDSLTMPGDENLSLSMPRMRDSTPARPASPLHLRINYEKREAV